MNEQNQTDIYYKLGEVHGDVKHILEQTTKTNGRVTKLEERQNKMDIKIAYYTGVFAVIIWIVEKLISKYA